MNLTDNIQKMLAGEVETAIKDVFKTAGVLDGKAKGPNLVKETKSPIKKTLIEALNVIPRSFAIKTEKLSREAKIAHEDLYKGYVEAFNKTSSALDAANREDSKSSASAFRSLKEDETYNFNALKLHELYFANISDLASESSVDSLTYMKLARDFGTFEKWQFDFIACAVASRNGWAMTVFEPYRKVYMNVVVDLHSNNIPIGCIPIFVLDMWEHAYYKDYVDDKKSYIVNMMREINWDVVEGRMLIAEDSNLTGIYKLQSDVNTQPEKMVDAAKVGNEAPIQDIQPSANTPGGSAGPLAPTAPPSPQMTPNTNFRGQP